MLKLFYWRVEMSICTRWWFHRCLQRQARKARKSFRQTAGWPFFSLPLRSGPGVAVSVDCFPVIRQGNCYIFLFTDRFSRRADMRVVSAAEFTAESTADILVNKYMPLWGYPVSLLSNDRLKFCSELSLSVYKLLDIRKTATSAYHHNGNGEVECVN